MSVFPPPSAFLSLPPVHAHSRCDIHADAPSPRPVALASGSLGALPASYMLASGRSYNLFFWAEFAVAAALSVAAFLLFEETMFLRGPAATADRGDGGGGEVEKMGHLPCHEQIERAGAGQAGSEAAPTVPRRKSWLRQLRIIDEIDHDSPVFMMVVSSKLLAMIRALPSILVFSWGPEKPDFFFCAARYDRSRTSWSLRSSGSALHTEWSSGWQLWASRPRSPG